MKTSKQLLKAIRLLEDLHAELVADNNVVYLSLRTSIDDLYWIYHDLVEFE